jgi:hypothetical protein
MDDRPADAEDDPQQAIRRSEGVRHPSGPIPFTDAAYEELTQRAAAYAEDLVRESTRMARWRDSPDIVSVGDVRRASQRLYPRSRGVWRPAAGSLGGLLLGAVLGNVLQIAGASGVTQENILLTICFSIVGTALIVVGLVRD